jgi:hypothetical protein
MDDCTVDRQPSWLELRSAVPLSEVEKITSLDRDSLIRHYSHLIVRVSPRRLAMRLQDALAIAAGTAGSKA